jgi:hypothetical protein
MYRAFIVSLCVQFGLGRNRALIIGRSAMMTSRPAPEEWGEGAGGTLFHPTCI